MLLVISMQRFFALLMLLQIYPQSGPGDARLQMIDYQADQVFVIKAVPGYQTTILLAPDEQVQNIAVGDSTAWQVSINKAGNQLFIKQMDDGLPTNMTVLTNVRHYAFDLLSSQKGSGPAPYSVQFRYPKITQNDGAGYLQDVVGLYRLTGNKALWPFKIADDGLKTYILWNAGQDLPAVYALDQAGQELLVNGMMRNGTYVVDAVAATLIFRIDKQKASAKRKTSGSGE
jgi:type IV secretion system protein VirB9